MSHYLLDSLSSSLTSIMAIPMLSLILILLVASNIYECCIIKELFSFSSQTIKLPHIEGVIFRITIYGNFVVYEDPLYFHTRNLKTPYMQLHNSLYTLNMYKE